MRNQIAGEVGLIKLTAAFIGVFVVTTVIAGVWSQWIFGTVALYVGWRAAVAMNK